VDPRVDLDVVTKRKFRHRGQQKLGLTARSHFIELQISTITAKIQESTFYCAALTAT
jgi:hypothetical protein